MTVLFEAPATTAQRRSPFLDFEVGCSHPKDAYREDDDGDPACAECRAEWAADNAEWRTYQYR
jgi:hypothetical protein